MLEIPKPDTLEVANVTSDILAVADAASADVFAYYGYSWLASLGLQLALRTDRLSALVMGGFPPLDGPYVEMLAVTAAAHRMASQVTPPWPLPDSEVEPGDWSTVEMTMSEPQTRQFVTLYESLQHFDERAALGQAACPRLCFAGSEDEIEYDERWRGVRVNMATPLRDHRAELEDAGWTVRLLDGLDHTGAMQAANVLPLIRPWLTASLLG